MDLDDIVLVVDAQMPVRAKRIKYYDDRFFKQIFDKQIGEQPYPSAGDQMRGLQGQIKALEVPREVLGDGFQSGGKQREEIGELVSEKREVSSGDTPSFGEYQAGTEKVERFMEEAANG